jgi:ribosomal protein S18 acetylase RimI-like enzyme
VVIRPVDEGEYQAVADLTVATYAAVLGTDLGNYRAELADVARRARHALVLVAVDEPGELLGSVTYVPGPGGPYAEFDGADEAGIRMLVVAPGAQRRGVGTALVQACLDRARADGKRRVSLHTTPAMTAAQRLYEGLGFVRAPERDWAPNGEVFLLGYVLVL